MPPLKDAARGTLILSLGLLAFALVIAFVWVPLDTDTGLIEKVRRRVTVGDSLAPTLAAAFIGLGALMMVFERGEAEILTWANLRFIAMLLGAFAVAFGLMRWTGPAAVLLVNGITGQELEYRLLRDTAPWKYLGFLVGNTLLIGALISAVQGRVTGRAVLIAVLATVALIVLYDVPFDDLLLPPNGDV